MKTDVIAKRYARALYDLGVEEDIQGLLSEDIDKVGGLVQESDQFRDIMESPLYDITLKKGILSDFVKKYDISIYTANLIQILVDKDRFEHVSAICDSYVEILNAASGRVRALVTSAIRLDDEQVKRIADVLSKKMEKQVDVDVAVDADLIGGVVAEVEGMVYDGSLRTQIGKVKERLKRET
ncbi:MAG: ATP synthase F1 subunit delta [Thermodesulfobacteriota bacterium]|nr:ATP synthase F1 subunit delta [Thermodesulfobacteriota bacterium]